MQEWPLNMMGRHVETLERDRWMVFQRYVGAP
jgi:hypothetical protein